jgi:hypothetical protein
MIDIADVIDGPAVRTGAVGHLTGGRSTLRSGAGNSDPGRMESFEFRPMTWPGLRALSRNPLVRASDRIESAVVVLAALVVLLAAAAAGAAGTMVYGAQTQMYARQAQTRHAIVATAVADSQTVTTAQTVITTVYARWQHNGSDQTAEIACNKPVAAGKQLGIWVDDRGNRVGRPVPASRAAAQAVAVAAIAWLGTVLAVAHAVSVVRTRTSRLRDAQWDREISCLVDDGGGHTNRMP